MFAGDTRFLLADRRDSTLLHDDDSRIITISLAALPTPPAEVAVALLLAAYGGVSETGAAHLSSLPSAPRPPCASQPLSWPDDDDGTSALTCINASGNAVYLTGRGAVQYAVGIGGPVALLNNSRRDDRAQPDDRRPR
jgi:hypothetical protein